MLSRSEEQRSTMEMTHDQERAHQLTIERADKDYVKRTKDRQKRFGKLHDIDEELVERARIATLNRNALITLMGQHRILIPARELPLWRPTLPDKGDIDGVQEAITIIATNGILGWFLTRDDQAWCGHIQCFTGEIKPLFSVPQVGKATKPKRPKGQKSKRQTILDTL